MLNKKQQLELELIKDCMIAEAEQMCPKKANFLSNISLSANIMAQRGDGIAKNISTKFPDKNRHLEGSL